MLNLQRIKIAIIIVFVVLFVGGIFAWQYFGKQREEPKKSEVVKNETALWQTYRNEEFGFEVRYPEDWKIKVNDAYGIVEIAPYELNPYFDHGAVFFPPRGQVHIAFYVDVLPSDIDFNEGWEEIPVAIQEESLPGILLEHRMALLEGEKKTLAKQRYWKGDSSAEEFNALFDQILSTFRFVK